MINVATLDRLHALDGAAFIAAIHALDTQLRSGAANPSLGECQAMWIVCQRRNLKDLSMLVETWMRRN